MAFIVNAKLEGLGKLRAVLGPRAARQMVRLIGRTLEVHAEETIDAVRRGDWFDNPTPELTTKLWVGRAKRVGGEIRVEAGWGSRHGPVLEWGPSVKSWVIEARFAKALRFRVGGQIVFRQRVVRNWTPDQLRPHFGPSIRKILPGLRRDLDAIPGKVHR